MVWRSQIKTIQDHCDRSHLPPVSLFLIFFKVIGLHKQCRALKRGDKGFLSDPSLSACEIFHVDFSKNDLTTHRKLMNMALPDTFEERAWNKSVSQKTENAVLFPPFSLCLLRFSSPLSQSWLSRVLVAKMSTLEPLLWDPALQTDVSC
jgi:hypothetical protein